MENGKPLLSVRGLRKYFPVTKGVVLRKTLGYVQAVDGVDFTIYRGQTFGLVGESGCGKTTVSKLLLKLEEPTAGVIEFEGKDINKLNSEELKYYHSAVQPVFQDPHSSLSPRMQVWEVITEPAIINLGLSASQNPFSGTPSYKAIADRPLADRVRIMRDPEFRRRLLS